VKQTPGSIGYVELAYARQNKLPVAEMKNAAGKFVAPTIEATTAAAAGVMKNLPPTTDYRISIVNAPGADAYPISSFTWLLVYEKQSDVTKGKKLLDFVKWALHDGEKMAASLDYAPLPAAMVAQLDKRLASMKLGVTH
jgi:phosphate transport system substrate-binding protein